VASTADHGDKDAREVAKSGELHQRQKYSRSDTRSDRRRNVTEEEIERIRELYQAGIPVSAIAAQVALSKSTVERYLGAATRRPRWTDDDNQILVDGYLEKKPIKEIAKKLNRSPTAVRVAMCRYRKAVNSDPKKKRVMGVMTYVLRVMRKADIFKELNSGVSSTSLPTQSSDSARG